MLKEHKRNTQEMKLMEHYARFKIMTGHQL